MRGTRPRPDTELDELNAHLAALQPAPEDKPDAPEPEPDPPPKPPNPGRDAGGKFAAGNSGGPGNPFARQVAHFRQAL